MIYSIITVCQTLFYVPELITYLVLTVFILQLGAQTYPNNSTQITWPANSKSLPVKWGPH